MVTGTSPVVQWLKNSQSNLTPKVTRERRTKRTPKLAEIKKS